nr:MAG TPA: hypothetical protein [Caudoviricetes sp.]
MFFSLSTSLFMKRKKKKSIGSYQYSFSICIDSPCISHAVSCPTVARHHLRRAIPCHPMIDKQDVIPI